MIHLWVILQTVKECQLFAMFSKCEFWLHSVFFLGYIMSSTGIRDDSLIIDADNVIDLPLQYQKLSWFLMGYYRTFVEGILSIASLLTKLTERKVKYQWSDDFDKIFVEIII